VIALFDLDDTPFVLTATGLALTFVGAFVVSSRLSEPNYDVMLGWNPDALPRNWEATQRYYFGLNWIRAAAS
jgi:hypothetical protein